MPKRLTMFKPLMIGLFLILLLAGSPRVAASSVKQISGNGEEGKFELVTNEFPTFELAKSFFDGSLEDLLSQQNYQGDLLPVDPSTANTTYIIKVRIDYSKDRLGSSREQVETLCWNIIAAADQAISKIKPIPGQNSTILINVYRLYHPGLRVHLYTTDTHEAKILQGRDWIYEGISWKSEQKKGMEVYRLYHPGLKVHLYTKDTNEYKVLASRGWKQEGVAYYSYGSIPIYRLYHPGLKKHLYTKDSNEYKVLAERGWLQEGVAWDSQS